MHHILVVVDGAKCVEMAVLCVVALYKACHDPVEVVDVVLLSTKVEAAFFGHGHDDEPCNSVGFRRFGLLDCNLILLSHNRNFGCKVSAFLLIDKAFCLSNH